MPALIAWVLGASLVAAPQGDTKVDKEPAASTTHTNRDDETPLERLPERPPPTPLGVNVDVMGGFLGSPTAGNPFASTVDPYFGARAGVRRPVFGDVMLGGEISGRMTRLISVGPATTVPLGVQWIGRLSGITPNQTLRQVNQLSLGATLGYRLRKLDFFLEPYGMLGVSTAMRTFIVQDDSPLLHFRSFPTLGGYAGLGFIFGLHPMFVRMDTIADVESGPPPFTAVFPAFQYNISLGVQI
ncbi:MAG: hypothetical protein AB2A00_38235 [Myxococcota bacterium]